MLWHGFRPVNGKRKEVVTEGQKLAVEGTCACEKPSSAWRIDGKAERVISIVLGGFMVTGEGFTVFAPIGVQFRD
jgi:hypothetical protein